jgi:hypothetical protein
VLAVVGLRHQHIDVPADHLITAIAKEPFGSPVEALDGAMFINRDDAVHSGIEDCRRLGFGITERRPERRRYGIPVSEGGPEGSQRPCHPPRGRNGDQGTRGTG